MANKHVLIPVSTGMSIRNILQGGIQDHLVGHGLAPVYLVPSRVVDTVREEIPGRSAEVDVLPRYGHRPIEITLGNLSFAAIQARHRIETIEIRHRLARRAQPGVPMKERLFPVMGALPALGPLLDRIREALFRAPEMDAPIRKWRPAVAFSNHVFDITEAALMRRARQRGIPTVAMVHSWDNPTNKGILPVRTDRLIVWSKVMRHEMESLFAVDPESIDITGAPQFDAYARPVALSRNEVLARHGLPEDRPLVVYATGAPVHCGGEASYPRLLADLSDGGRRFSLLVRLHPRDLLERYAGFADRPGVAVERPGRTDDRIVDTWLPTLADHQYYCALMRHADVVVNIASTVALDAACNDTPVIHIAYDPEPGLSYLDSTRRLFDYTHTARLMGCNSSYVARRPEDVGPALQRALDNPQELHDARVRLSRQEGYDGTGAASERIATVVAGMAG